MKLGFIFAMLAAATFAAGQAPKTMVFLAGSEPEVISGSALLGASRGAIEVTRSAPSYDIESMQSFTRYCPGVVMTTRQDKADVVIRVEREEPNPTTPFVEANKIAVFNLNDELVYATRARLLSNASKDACRAIQSYVKH